MSTATKTQARDLEADLAICEAATAGPWTWQSWEHDRDRVLIETELFLVADAMSISEEDAEFIAAAREGWPYAIRRALEAEAEADRLRNELQIYQERDRGARGC